MAKIQPVWAIDIGQAAMKALKLVPGETPDQVVAEAFDFIEYPKILSQPDADAEQLVREALETFLERNDLKGCKVAISVPGQAGLVKFIKLPPVEKKRIPDIVKFEARQQIPFALEEVVWSYQQIGGDDDEEDFAMAEVGLFAMKRDQINRAILPLRVAGIEVDIVQMGPIALFNFIAFDQIKGNEVDGSVVVLDIGADNTDLIITDGTRIWQRNVPIGGNHFTRALTKELKLTFAKAEHLKRNATKAPDPRAVFTAMRGVFNDFASEINRSIGFYGSVNRSAKIAKVVGMGNGFKLPGLQKFLQQNISHEVEKLETFARLVPGDEVKDKPTFEENLPSFAVAYGLAAQGLGKGPLQTNLLPPEIEQIRMVRRKKPWALAASALLMLGFSALFLGDWKAWAKVTTNEFKAATDKAKSAANLGKQHLDAYNTAKSDWEAKHAEGKALVVDNSERAMWPQFLKVLNYYLPDPVRDLKLDPRDPRNARKIDELRVHIDAIKPVWREDVALEWFDLIPEQFRNLMHAYDRETPPEGPGWIVQIIGHHYNPTPDAEHRKLPPNEQWKLGPWNYLSQRVLPRLQVPEIRQFGIHHVALAWLTIDKKWTTAAGAATNNLAAAVPLLPRASAPAGEGGEMGGMMGEMGGGYGPGMMGGRGGMMGGGSGMMGGGSGMMGGGYGPGMMGEMGGEMGGMMGGRGGMMGGYGPGMMGGADAQKNITTLTRTDFLIQFVWQPPDAESGIRPIEEIRKAMAEAAAAKKGAVRVDEEALSKASGEASRKALEAFFKARQAAIKATPEGGEAPAEGADAAPGAATPPADASKMP